MKQQPAADFATPERIVLALLAIAMVLAAGLVGHRQALQETSAAFEKEAHHAEIQVSRQLAEGATLITALHGLLQGASVGADAHLPGIARRIVRDHPQVTWVGHAVSVLPGQRAAFEARLEREGFVGFRIHPLPGAPRAVAGAHLALSSVEPLSPMLARLLGADLLSVPGWHAAVEAAIERAEVRAIAVSGEHLGRSGFLLLRATYLGNVEPPSAAERRQQVAGLVLAFVDRDTLLSQVRLSEPSARVRIGGDGAAPDPEAAGAATALARVWRPKHLSRRVLPFAGTTVPLEVRARPPIGMRGLLVDMLIAAALAASLLQALRMHRRARREERVAQARARLAQVTLHSIGEAVVRLDDDGQVHYMNPGAERMSGLSAADAHGRALEQIFPLQSQSRADADLLARLGDSQTPMLLHAPGRTPRAVACTLSQVDPQDGEAGGRVLVMRDVTREHELSRELAYQASHDPLTDLPNRREFERRLERAVADFRATGAAHCLCYVDLDQFKIVNDTCGHFAGDRLLRQVAGLLGAELRDEDLLARLGGDEFGILLRGCELEQAMQIAERICRHVSAFRFDWDGRSFDIGASIGVVAVTAQAGTVDELQRAADLACYAAKETGRNRVHLYRHEDRVISRNQREMRWHAELRSALEQQRFTLHAQLIQPLRSGASAQVMEELLLRLLDADGNVVPPMSFLPAAERYGMMGRLDRVVIDKAFAMVASRACAAHTFTINLSGQSLSDAGLGTFVLDAAKRHGVDPCGVCFEITETAAISNLTHAMALMERLRGEGFRFALDDFGAGVSSFGYLKQLPLDFIKIDGQFVRDLGRDPVARVIVSSVISVARVLKLETVAEKVEDDTARRCLENLGVDYVQGYLIGRPRPLAAEPSGDLARTA